MLEMIFQTCRLLNGNVWKRELSIIQRRALRKLRKKKRYIKKKIYPIKNLYSYNQSFHKESTQFIFTFASILLSYLALAGAAMSMGFPLVFHFSIFSVMYYTFVYVLLYINTKYSLYERTIELIKKEEDFIDFYLKVCYIFVCFCYFIYSYNFFKTLPEVEEEIKKDLVNPLQVVAQLSCFFFYFKYKRSDVRERQLILLCFVFCVISTLYIIKVKHFFLCFMISVFSVYVYKKNMDYVPLSVLLFYTLDDSLAKWGFFLLFQQLSFYALSISLDKEQNVPPRSVIKIAILLQLLQFLIGIQRGDCYLAEPAKLAVLLSGASIVFICLKKRRKVAFLFAFFIYFMTSIFIGIASLPGIGAALDLYGLSIFVLGHIIFLWGLNIFILPHEKQGIVPFLFYTLFYLLPYLPHLKWISKWIEGFDLLLFFLSLFSFIEESRASHGGQEEGTSKKDPPNDKEKK